MRRSINVGVALVGLLVVAAISVAAGSGRKPARQERANTSVRVLTGAEAGQLGKRFPGLQARVQITGDLLERLFPRTAFYRAFYHRGRPDVPYLTSISDTSLLPLPSGFNRLLRVYDMEVTDDNKVELAKALVLMAIGDENGFAVGLDSFPPVTFVDADVTEHRINYFPYGVELKVKIGEQLEVWHFAIAMGKFVDVLRLNTKGRTINFYNPGQFEPPPGRSQLDLGPQLIIEDTVGDAYLEYYPNNVAWYFLTVDTNSTATHDTVVFSLSGFPPESTNVYLAVRDNIRSTRRHIGKVQMASGCGSLRWSPPKCSTGYSTAYGGYADPSDPWGTFTPITAGKVLTLERLNSSTFPGADTELLLVYFCDQFFMGLPGGEAHAAVFAQYSENAMHESWQTQVGAWGLGSPADADNIHEVFINDSLRYFHVRPQTYTEFGGEQKIGIQAQLWYADSTSRAYSSESIRVKDAVAHEFYHGIQWGLDSAKVVNDTWNWFTEGQARFIQSAQYPNEEFSTTGGQVSGLRQYPRDANKYLTQYLNTSLRTLSADSSIAGYPYCLFWRFMYERFQLGGMRIVRDCYAETVGTSNSISQGKLAIDRAIARYSLDPTRPTAPPFSDFLQGIDEFAIACYLNDTSLGQWHDPNKVYSSPPLTADTTFRLGASETDSIVIRNSVPNSYGFDLIQLRLNDDVDSLLVSCSLATTILQARLVRVFPATPRDTFNFDSLRISWIGGASGQISTHGADRVCLVITRHDTLDDPAGGGYVARFNVTRAVGVSDLLPAADTAIAGTYYTPKAIVVNRGWMKEVFPATFTIGLGYSCTKTCTLDVSEQKMVTFDSLQTTKGTFAPCCSVYIASDTTRSDDTLRASLIVLGDTWQVRPSPPPLEGANDDAALAAVGDTLVYAFLGKHTRGFYCYDTRSRYWDQKASPCDLCDTIEVGAALTWNCGTYIYALLGCPLDQRYLHHYELLRYDIESDGWAVEAALPRPFGPASDLVWAGDGCLYALEGGWAGDSAHGFYRYDGSWTRLDSVPGTCFSKPSLCADQAGHVYALCAAIRDTFCQYDMSTGDWTVMDPFPEPVASSELVYNGLDSSVYAMTSHFVNGFRRYDAVPDNWSDRADPLGPTTSHPGGLASCAGFVYSLTAKDNVPTFSRYAPDLSLGGSRLAAAVVEPARPLGVMGNRFEVSPSPARGAVRVQWQVGEPGAVVVRVFDNAGRVVRTIQNGYQTAGRYSVRWDGICDNGRRAANGIFFYRLDAPGFHKIVKVVTVSE